MVNIKETGQILLVDYTDIENLKTTTIGSAKFLGRVHLAGDVRKVRPYRLDAFDSGDAGVLGVVEEGSAALPRLANGGAARPYLCRQRYG